MQTRWPTPCRLETVDKVNVFYVWKATDDQSYLEAETCFKFLLLALACCTFSHDSAILDALASLTRVGLRWDQAPMGYHGRQCVVMLTGFWWSRLKALISVNITADISATKLGCLVLHELTCVDS
jgi:hypothetical protein